MSQRLNPARMIRLCLKELRESLRDRRTIVTLVLMPLLVYPLLSLVLNRVLLTNTVAQHGTFVSIGIGHELEQSEIAEIIQLGYYQLNQRDLAPVFLEEVTDDVRTPGKPPTPRAAALPEPQLITLDDSGRSALRNGSVDVVIIRKAPSDDASTAVDKSLVQTILKGLREANRLTPEADLQNLMDVVGTYEVRYRDRDPQSERALQLLERCLAALNIDSIRIKEASGYTPPFRLLATPVAMKSNYSDLLATMVPLVLVLMTMAGAVYPAIDLTAGERERGTMEALIVSPTPTAALLLAKYSAVVTVALLTALANLAAMSITLWVSGIGKVIFGDGVLSTGVIGTILVLLILFTMFFAALLLAVTSFAKSFKEAQAYLIPLMLLALTPGVMSLLPGIKFTTLLATVPLVNIVLLARQVLVGAAEWNTAVVAVTCNGVYALGALVLASRLFGSDASMQGSQGSWRDLAMRPAEQQVYPSVDQMALTMCAMFPFYFVASSVLPSLSSDLATKLWLSAIVSFVLIFCLPLLIAWYRRIRLVTTFRLNLGNLRAWPAWIVAIPLLGLSAWMFAHEIFILAQVIGIGTIKLEHLERVAEFRNELAALPLLLILAVFAFTPAICEEILFRGFVLSSLHRYPATWAIFISAVLFGMMHVLTSNVLAVERFLPTTFMGVLLAWIALRTGSIVPGMLLHAVHNGFLLSVTQYQDQLKRWNILVEEGQHLPPLWLAVGGLAFLSGICLFWISTRHASVIHYPVLDENIPSPT